MRSPAEYQQGHIPGAISLPLFSDEERKVIGTLYKQEGRNTAVRKGLEFIGPKLIQFVDQVDQLVKDPLEPINVHCWRGGMRSASMATLLETAGFKTLVIRGGYKAYRNWGGTFFRSPWNLMILTGHTGSAKTEILHELKKQGEQILDLEDLANHRGSSFGSLGQESQPTTEHFQNLIAQELSTLDSQKRLWVEDESIRIGQCHLPNLFFDQMRESSWVKIERPRQQRIKHLTAIYGSAPKQELSAAIERLSRRLGGLRLNQCLESLERDDPSATADLLLDYYDKSYDLSISKREKSLGRILTFDSQNEEEIATQILNSVNGKN